MIFDVSPLQIRPLESKQLVELLRKLLHAEAQQAGISLRSVSAPLQITIPDGGEDARISWEGGRDSTDYLPSRFSIFQSKATDLNAAGWKKEVWTKATQKKGASRQLIEAVSKTIEKHGSYIGFTNAALVGPKYDACIQAIKDGIKEAGADPVDLRAIDIYDANKIAEWASRHPSVGVWLTECQSGLTLGGFHTIEGWGKRGDFSSIAHVSDTAARYIIGGVQTLDQEECSPPDKHAFSFQQAKERVSDHLAEPRTAVRLIGPSGLGKSRFVFETFNDSSTLAKSANALSAVYCDFRHIGQQLFAVASTLAKLKSPTLLIVDECPRDEAAQLYEIISSAESQLRVLTIDIDDRPIQSGSHLNISVSRGDDQLVEGIIRQRLPKLQDQEITYIKDLCGGFPRIAVLATASYAGQIPLLNSIEDVVDRILKGSGIHDKEQIRAVECLALFNMLGADGEFSDQFDCVAEQLAGLTGDRMYEHISFASQHHLVDRRGRFFYVQPTPIAAFLGNRRLELLRVTTLVRVIKSSSPNLSLSLLEQWRYFDQSKTAMAVAEQLMAGDGVYGTMETLNMEVGSRCLDSLVHVAPDVAADTIHRVFGGLTIDELADVKDGRRYLVLALNKLVFRKRSFAIAARMLLRLATVENESWSNNAAGHFKQLFQLRLSGTEVAPPERFLVLDEGLVSNDQRMLEVCLGALENTLNRSHFSRPGGAEQIGCQPPLHDWHPKTLGEALDFHRAGLKRLSELRVSNTELRDRCEKAIASHIRGMISEDLFDDVVSAIDEILASKGLWLDAIEAVGDWLYFDREGANTEFSEKVRMLYDRLIPTNLIQKALLYTKFWSADIRDPDLTYQRDNASGMDFDYSSRKAREVAAEIAADEEATKRAIQLIMKEDVHNTFPFAEELGLKVSDPLDICRFVVNLYEGSEVTTGVQFICGLLTGIDKRCKRIADECVPIALKSPRLNAHAIQIYAAVDLTSERLNDVISGLQHGQIPPEACAFLSYGKHMDSLKPAQILPLLSELATKYEETGIWTALEMVSMYQHNRKDLDSSLVAFIKEQLSSPKLLKSTIKANRDGYIFERLVSLVEKDGGLDDDFATQLSEQSVRICQAKDHDIFYAMDEPIRTTLKLLVNKRPVPTWQTLSRFYEMATLLERHRIKDLVGPDRHTQGDESSTKEGLLFGVPEFHLLTWARIDPSSRIAFLCSFYPLLVYEQKEGWTWHGAIETLALEFGHIQEFRDAVGLRLHPTSWTGSLVPHLKIFLEPLEKWCGHNIADLSLWAHEMLRSLERQISKEQSRDDEDFFQ